MAYRISSRVPVSVKSLAFMEYMPSSLNRIFVAWAFEIFIRKKPKTEFPNWCMVGNGLSVKIVDGGLYFIFSFHFILLYFYFYFLFFYFQNNLGQGLSVTLSHQSQIDGIVTRLIIGLGRMKQKVLEQSDVIQHGQHMLASCYTHGHLGQGAQQLAWTMGNSI